MAFLILTLVSFLFLKVFLVSDGLQQYEKPEEYIGCYHDDVSDRVFSYSPGDYVVDQLTPVQCMLACGTTFKYAAIQQGKICLCALELPDTFVEETECNSKCNGVADQAVTKCGGLSALSVYTIDYRIIGLSYVGNTTTEVLKQHKLAVELKNGKNVSYSFNFGDGYREIIKGSAVLHFYDKPGSYDTIITASSNVSGEQTIRTSIKVIDNDYIIDLDCPISTIVGHPITCIGSMFSGSTADVKFDFGDGQHETIRLGAQYTHLGRKTYSESQNTDDGFSSGTVIFFTNSFTGSQKITDWEILVAQPGRFFLQVYRPVCSPDKKYCTSTKLCQDDTMPCPRDKLHTCSAEEVFCLHSSRCATMGYQTSILEMSEAIPALSYTVVYQLGISVSTLGRHLTPINQSEMFETMPGDVLGWAKPNHGGGQLQSIKKENGSVDCHILALNISQFESSKCEIVKSYSFALAAHYRSKASFMFTHNFTQPGRYRISTNISSDFIIFVDYPIKNISFHTLHTAITTEEFRLDISEHQGSNVTYEWHMGDSHTLITQNRSISFTYKKPGIYTILLNATNSVSHTTVSHGIKVFTRLQGLHFLHRIQPIVIGNAIQLFWSLEQGSNITYIIDFGDNSSLISIEDDRSNNLTSSISHTFTKLGNYTMKISASNYITSPVNITEFAIVQEALETLSFLPNVNTTDGWIFAAVNDTLSFKANLQFGSDYTCAFQFNDTSLPLLRYHTPLIIIHTFKLKGIFELTVTCDNLISSLTEIFEATILIERLEAINGLSVYTKETLLGNDSVLQVDLPNGTVYSCNVNLGDETSLTINPSAKGEKIIHRYQKIGNYSVDVKCVNRLGSQETHGNVMVGVLVKNVSLLCPQLSIRSAMDFEVIVVFSEGSSVTVSLLVDGSPSDMITSPVDETGGNVTLMTSLDKPGVYIIGANVRNMFNEIVSRCENQLRIQTPVTDFIVTSNSPVRLQNGVIRYDIQFSNVDLIPTNATIMWWYGNGEFSEMNLASFEEGENHRHRFETQGSFITNVSISNEVSSISKTCIVQVQKMKNISIEISEIPMRDGNEHFVAVNVSILLSVTQQPNDQYYVFSFNDSLKIQNSTNSSTLAIFQQPGKLLITAVVYNVLGKFTVSKSITVVKPMINVIINATKVIKMGDTLILDVNSTSFGSDTCIFVDMGDGTKLAYERQAITVNCESNYDVITELETEKLSIEHEYTKKGMYTVSVILVNPLQNISQNIDITVRGQLCESPSIEIFKNSSENHPLIIKKSDRIIINSNITSECDFADEIIIQWIICESNTFINGYCTTYIELPFQTRFNSTMPLIISSQFDPTGIDIPKLTLPYGRSVVQLHVWFGSDSVNLKGIESIEMLWLQVNPTPLEPKIQGGFSRAVGFELWYRLDASESIDPDASRVANNESRQLKYQWYCRRDTINDYPSSYNTSISLSDHSCFANRSYALDEHNTTIRYLTNSNDKLEIFTGGLAQLQSYTFRVIMSKGNRQSFMEQEIKVLPGNPPTMEITCKLNCKSKVNPAERLILGSRCTDCYYSTRLYYQWELFEMIDEQQRLPISNLNNKTTTLLSEPNVAVKGDVFEQGKVYLLRVSAWKEGGKLESAGFSVYRFKVNLPPQGGNCDVEPKTGFTLETKFRIFCQNWQDEDMPLFYLAYAIRGSEIMNLYKGVANSAELILPLGEEKDEYKYDIAVSVSDKFGFVSETKFTVQVNEPYAVDLNKVSNSLESLTGSGNEQELAQTALAAGSLMNKESNSTESENAEARSNMINSISQVTACDIDGIKQYGDVFKEMTAKTDEISDDAQSSSSDAMARMSDCMLKADAQSSGMESAAKSMFHASSNVLAVSQLSVKKRNGTNTTDIDGEYTRNGSANNSKLNSSSSAAGKVFDTVDKVGGSLSRQMIRGDKPLKISTGNMDVEVGKVTDDADDEDTGFKLPPSASLLGNNSDEEASNSIAAIKTSMKESPYDSSDGDSHVNSEIQGLSLTNSNGEAIDLSGQVIEMFVPKETKNDVMLDVHTIDTDSRMNFHRFNCTNPNSGFALEIRPIDSKIRFSIYLNENSRPSSLNYTMNYSIPTLEEASRRRKLPDPFTYVFGKNQLDTSVEYFVGVRVINMHELYGDIGYLPNTNYTFRIFEMSCKLWNDELKIWTIDECDVGAKTTFNKTHCICHLGGPLIATNETTEADIEDQSFAPSFAKLISGNIPTTPLPTQQPIKRVIRQPVKRVSLASSIFPSPNPIDFNKAFAGFANLAENPIAFSVVLSILGVYLFLLFWARREDRKDITRAGVTVLDENDPNDQQFFEVTVYTGFSSNASTTSNVYVQFLGDDGETEPRELQDSSRKIFQRRGEDVFLISCPESIGSLSYVRVWHSNSGKSPSWYLRRITVRDVISNQKYLFINEAYLGVEHGTGEVDKLLPVAGPDEITSFNNLFYSTTTKNLSDGHIWFSIFIRPAKSRFTRVQRLSCCLTLLYCTMIANAMFYNIGGETDPSSTVTIGPLSFSLAQIGIGIMSSLVVFPVNIIIVTIFRAVEPKPPKRVLKKRRSRSLWCLKELFFCCNKPKDDENDFMEIITTVKDTKETRSNVSSKDNKCGNIDLFKFDTNSIQNNEIQFKLDPKSKSNNKKKKSKTSLPYWLIYFAWALLILTSFTSSFFVVLYGFQFGKEKSAQFLSSLLISFIQDVLISQPLKILCLGLFIALVIKKPEDEQEEGGYEKKDDEIFLHETDSKPKSEKKPSKEIIRFQPPSKEKIKAARDYRIKEIKMYAVVRDIFIYFFFVISLCIVSYSHMDPSSYAFSKSLEDTFINGVYGGSKTFFQISNREDVWSWLNTTVVNGLYPTHWYNGMVKEPGFTQDMNANAFGGARLRQLRVQPDSCVLPDVVSTMIDKCNDWYSVFNEDTDHYDPRWLPLSNHSLYYPHRSYKSWEYSSSSELDTYPLVGAMGSYSGGGYVANLGNYPQETHEIITDLASLNWLDGRTRALFLEITVYNAQINLFGIMNFVVESIPTNGYVMFKSIKIARLYSFGGGSQSLILACQLFIFFFLFLFLYKEFKKIHKERKKYFRSFWNCVEMIMIILVISTVAIFFSRLMLVKSAVNSIKNSHGQFVSFNKVAAWDNLFVYVSSSLVMLSCIKSIRLLSFNKTISLLASTLKGCLIPLGAFSMVFLIFFMAYVQWSFVMFVNHLYDYRSFIAATESTMALLLGSYDFHAMESAQRIMGPLYFCSLMVFGVFYIMNVFLTIIMDTYADVKDDITKQNKDYEVVEFMISKLKKLTGLSDGTRIIEEIDTDKDFLSKSDDNTEVVNDNSDLINDDLLIKFQQLDSSLVSYYTDDYLDDSYLNAFMPKESSSNGDKKQNEEEKKYRQEMLDELSKWN